ncbi:acyl-CoA dehydrogenase [Sphingomonas sp. Root710]|uniref:acyl-CoA dehydrogenase family protein n=1 Tax=Sphingomonas sp. Root710 TaxID=1736594 RepID=UPI0006F73917|nr:acyl-CoA dehydrogenase family protein [Sphingomonas sp. Root710]KRB86952.1 acyl-CoA dehydrogenase [Sphingomonas sp. Root710]
MDFSLTERERNFSDRVHDFMTDEVRPVVSLHRQELEAGGRFAVLQSVVTLKEKAKAAGLWNLFMPPTGSNVQVDDSFEFTGERLTNLEYALCAEEMGRIHWASEVFNCSAPDTGNMEVLHRYGTRAQKERWLKPLMEGEIRSAFLMTEPDIASSDAINIQTDIRRDGDFYVINGRKWWSTGVPDPRCKVAIVMGKTDPGAEPHRQQAMILVDLDTPGITIERRLSFYGYDHAPTGEAEVTLTNVRVPAESLLLGEGRGFEIAQGRLGPGRIHHCMRTIGIAEEALEAMTRRLLSRSVFGKRIADHSVWEERIARARIDIEMTRLLCLKAADMMDRAGNKAARNEIAMIKVQAPHMALQIIDDAVQAHGGAGVSADFHLAYDWAAVRTLRIADGPDEVHARSIARAEFGKYKAAVEIGK